MTLVVTDHMSMLRSSVIAVVDMDSSVHVGR
jgi:hypothetical protein